MKLPFKIFIGLSVLFLVSPCVAQEVSGSVSTEHGRTGDLNSDSSDNQIYSSAGLTVQARFPGGIGAFSQFIIEKMWLPNFKESLQIKLYVSFVVERDGSMGDFKILRDPGYGLGEEVIRVLKLIETKWSPGIYNGKAVRSSMALPIVINVK